jgi:hypothetical protein
MGIMIFKGENLRYIFSMKKSSHNSYTIHRAGTQTKKTLRVKQAEVVLVPWVSLFALFLSLFILSCPPPANPPADDPPPPDVDQWVLDRTLEHEGITRYWDYYTPAGLGDNPPMLILLHGERAQIKATPANISTAPGSPGRIRRSLSWSCPMAQTQPRDCPGAMGISTEMTAGWGPEVQRPLRMMWVS